MTHMTTPKTGQIRFADSTAAVHTQRGEEFTSLGPILRAEFTKVDSLDFLTVPERRFYSQVVTSSFVNMYRLIQRHTESALTHAPVPASAGVAREDMLPAGYEITPDSEALADLMRSRSNWVVRSLALAMHEVSKLYAGIRDSVAPAPLEIWNGWFALPVTDASLQQSQLVKEWAREDGKLSTEDREKVVDELTGLIAAIDTMLKLQARADARYFVANCFRDYSYPERKFIENVFLQAYRYLFVVLGMQSMRFADVLDELTTAAQKKRISEILIPIAGSQKH